MLLILTMISGIREVLTPGAWRRQGSAYKLNDPAMESTRQRSLQHLRTALFDYARLHEGRFPPHDFIAEIPAKLWEAPDREGTRYVYQSGLTILQTNALLASEPPVFGERRYALLAGGALQLLVDADIRRLANIPPP
jgi:hypothetical protein